MTGFADHPSAALGRVLGPVVEGQVAGIDPVMGVQRFAALLQEFEEAGCQRGEPAVETHRQQSGVSGFRVLDLLFVSDPIPSALITFSSPGASIASGFSTNTCLPACSARAARSACVSCRVRMATVLISGSFRISSSFEAA